MRRTGWLLVSFLLAGLAGCGYGRGFEVARVSGKVTLNGKPLSGATVALEPESKAKDVGPGASGVTDADGTYSLTTIDGKQGATVGPNIVHISTFKMKEMSETESDA